MKILGRYIDSRRIAPLAVIVTFMIVTIGHVANYAGAFEATGWGWLGWPYALAVDIAIITCAYFGQWATTRRWAWTGFLLFTAASGVMNAAAIQPWLKDPAFPAWVYAEFPTVAIALLGFLYRSIDKLVAGKERKHGEGKATKSKEKSTTNLTWERMSKKERVLSLATDKSNLSQASIAVKAECSEGYVSKILSSGNGSKASIEEKDEEPSHRVANGA